MKAKYYAFIKTNLIFEQNGLSQSITRAGWAWGCSSADFDNNGYPDVVIGNGLETRQFVQDYESEYWLHDRLIDSVRSVQILNWNSIEKGGFHMPNVV